MKKPTKDELKRVMSMLGKKGGRVKSPRKTAAARLNATRPRKKKIAA